VGDALGGLLGGNVAKQIGSVNIKNLNASAELKGNVTITARPKLAAAWRIEPNLAGAGEPRRHQPLGGRRPLNVRRRSSRLLDKTVADQLAAVQARMRNDPAFEQSAKLQWAKACRSIPLQGTGATGTMPPLWLELRPIRAIAAQPARRCVRGDADARIESRDAHHRDADQTRLPVPGDHHHRAADTGPASRSACRSTCPLLR